MIYIKTFEIFDNRKNLISRILKFMENNKIKRLELCDKIYKNENNVRFKDFVITISQNLDPNYLFINSLYVEIDKDLFFTCKFSYDSLEWKQTGRSIFYDINIDIINYIESLINKLTPEEIEQQKINQEGRKFGL